MKPISYQRVVALFATRHDIPEAGLTAFRGRLQHFQRKGFPAGVNTGRGKPANYGWSELLQIGVALELLEAGWSPESAANYVGQWAPEIMTAVRSAMREGAILPVKTIDMLIFSDQLDSIRGFKMENPPTFHLSNEKLPGSDLPNGTANPRIIISLRPLIGDIFEWLCDTEGRPYQEVWEAFTGRGYSVGFMPRWWDAFNVDP